MKPFGPFLVMASLALAGAIAGALSGCASAAPAQKPMEAVPSEPVEPETAAREAITAKLAEARRLVEEASPASLSRVMEALAGPELAGEVETTELASLGRELYGRLYPEMKNPFPEGLPASSPANAGASGFFAEVLPALSLLDPGSEIEAAQEVDLEARLAAADRLNGASVLPPYLRALLLERQGKPSDDALALFRESLRRAPSFYPAKRKAADILLAAGKPDEALALLEDLAALLPPDSRVFGTLARAALAAGQPQKAADASARAIMLDPENADLIILRAEAFEALEDWYRALWLLDALLGQKPDIPAALLMKARLLYEKTDNADEAIKVAAEGEERFPGDPGFPELRGMILLSEGKTQEGLAAVNRALSLEPDRISALTILLRDQTREAQWPQAAETLARISPPARTAEHLSLGWKIATNLGDHDQALAYAGALSEKLGGEEPLIMMVRSLIALGRTAEARESIELGLADAKTPGARSELYTLKAATLEPAVSGAAGGVTEEIAASLRSALRENPENLEALLALSDLLAGEGDFRKALGYLKMAAELSPGDAGLRLRVEQMAKQAESGQ